MKPLISIIVPTFNAAQQVSAAIESVIRQTYLSTELLIMDGLSTDRTKEVVNEFIKSDSRVHWISEPDNGIYDAMNKGIARARGEWLLFLGSDDKLYSNTVLEEIFSAQKSRLYDVIYGDVYSTQFNGRYDGVFSVEKLQNQNICHQAIFFNKRVFKVVGEFNLKYKPNADWEHNMRWFFNRKIKHLYIDCIISNYADGGLSSTLEDKAFIKDRLGIYFRNAYFFLDKSRRKDILNQLLSMPHTTTLEKAWYKFLFHLNRL